MFYPIVDIAAMDDILYFENYDLDTIVTPVDVDCFEHLLVEANYDKHKTRELISGFREGFDIGYRGPENVRINAPNLKFREIGNEKMLWNKVMKEVKVKRYAGPYKSIPFDSYIQSPIGLVPKDGGKDCRLIFHLSYPRGTGTSLNANTCREGTTVNYPDFDLAVKLCIQAGVGCKIGRSDMRSAFRNLGILKKHWKYLIMKARNPLDGEWYYFVDKCLPFGASISCAHFQKFSDAVAHLVRFRTLQDLVNYLDDFLFVALLVLACNRQVQAFLDICQEINFPVSEEKTFWAASQMTFLGMLLDTVSQTVSVPTEKIVKGLNLIERVLSRKKIAINQLQKICGFLNFLGRCVLPGRAFTRRLYSYLGGKNSNLKPHHHVRINYEMRQDLETWRVFLKHPSVFCRSFMDFSKTWNADEISMFSDASKKTVTGGFGAICQRSWMAGTWELGFIEHKDPSIEYLELFGVVAAVVTWIHRFRNRRIILFCDNNSVVGMINKMSTPCKNCMNLLRILILKGMVENVRIFSKHLPRKFNQNSDWLSKGEIAKFKAANAGLIDETETNIPEELWPVSKIWND